MIAVDTSVIIAMAFAEPEAAAFDAILSATDLAIIGAPTLLEARMVLAGRVGAATADRSVAMLMAQGWRIIPFDTAHFAAAADAFDRFGKGRHRAALNYGDCMAYAVAVVAGCPLLYKGDDFARTDIRSAR